MSHLTSTEAIAGTVPALPNAIAGAPSGTGASPTVTHASDRVRGNLTFDGVLKGEWIKLLSLRSIRWSILVMLLLSWSAAGLLSLAMAGSGALPADALAPVVLQAATFGSMFTVLIMGVLGVLSVTSEYASGMILSSLAAVPARTPMLLAKALVVAALGFAVGAISSFGGALISVLVLGGGAASALTDAAVLVSLLGNTLYLTLAALLALGVGALLRSSAGAISVVVGLLFVATIAMQVLSITGWEWVPTVNDWLPANLGSTLSSVALDGAAGGGSVTYWGALGGLAVWAAAALVPAAILLKTRDAV